VYLESSLGELTTKNRLRVSGGGSSTIETSRGQRANP